MLLAGSAARPLTVRPLAGWLPPELQSYIVFTGSIGAAAKQPADARTLLNLLTSPAAVALFKAQGFEPTPSFPACSVCDYRLVCPAAER